MYVCSCQSSPVEDWDNNILPERISNLELPGNKTALYSGMSSWNKGVECAQTRMGQ